MALSIFVDALPYNEVATNYQNNDWQISQLIPNIAYSSSLHWQLFCNKYPDQRGVLVDWVKEPEMSKSVRFWSIVLAPLDYCGIFSTLARKFFDRLVFRRNAFANIPFRFRKDFTEKGTYLFWNEETYRTEATFDGYVVISQDEGQKSFDTTIEQLEIAINAGEKNIFASFGEVDRLGHSCNRGERYTQLIKQTLNRLFAVIRKYNEKNPGEEILLVSDHGMSSVQTTVDLELKKHFGSQSNESYIAYCDSALMCVFCKDPTLKERIATYLRTRQEGHLLTEEERKRFGATDLKFGDLIYILKEGNVFAENWFGKSLRKPSPHGIGMHGFWPERCAEDQMACMILINGKNRLPPETDYPAAYKIISRVMKGTDM